MISYVEWLHFNLWKKGEIKCDDYQTVNIVIVYIIVIVVIADPAKWTEAQITKWLQWAIQEFHLESINMNNFRMTGQTLAKMAKEDFLQLAPPFMGDILWEHLDCLKKGKWLGNKPSLSLILMDYFIWLCWCLFSLFYQRTTIKLHWRGKY